MKPLQIFLLALLLAATSGTGLSAKEQLTNVRVYAYEYQDYYALPDTEQWRKVKSVKIVGQNKAGSTQVSQTGPAGRLEATLFHISVPSTYWITVVWDDGTNTYQTHTSTPQSEMVHHIYSP